MRFRAVMKKPAVYLPISILLIIGIVLAGVSVWGTKVLAGEAIYPGVRAGQVELGGLKKEAALAALGEAVGALQNQTVSYSLAGKPFDISLANVDYDCDLEKTVANAYLVGRTGNFFSRLFEVHRVRKKGYQIDLDLQIDRESLIQSISSYAGENGFALGDYSTEITEEYIIIRPNKPGQKIDLQALVDDFIAKIRSGETTGGEVPTSEVHFDRTDVDRLYNEITTQPVDARYEEKNGVLTGIEAKDGISFDKEVAREILREEKEEYRIPIIRTKAAYTLENLDQGLYKDLLSIYTTNFSTNASRTANIRIAADKINNCILMPGQTFSFNQIVGPRTAEAGYQNATIYTANGLEDGLAGGICQVSSTLYNAVILADLEIVSRTNHSYTVSYVPLGCDATVSYGAIDFKFKNNQNTPVKIKTSVTANSISISMNGIKQEPGKVIKTRNQVLSTTPAGVKEVEDGGLAVGQRVLRQNGQSGYVVETYKDTYIDGNLVKTETLPRSNYIPLPTVYAVGPAEPTPSPTPTPTPDVPAGPAHTVTPAPTPTPPPTPIPEIPAENSPTPTPDAAESPIPDGSTAPLAVDGVSTGV